uniref:Secreted protein n=1 Tax=Arundo donax TaxID=35708 RepID=A0A0A9GQ61_ARUDO
MNRAACSISMQFRRSAMHACLFFFLFVQWLTSTCRTNLTLHTQTKVQLYLRFYMHERIHQQMDHLHSRVSHFRRVHDSIVHQVLSSIKTEGTSDRGSIIDVYFVCSPAMLLSSEPT